MGQAQVSKHTRVACRKVLTSRATCAMIFSFRSMPSSTSAIASATLRSMSSMRIHSESSTKSTYNESIVRTFLCERPLRSVSSRSRSMIFGDPEGRIAMFLIATYEFGSFSGEYDVGSTRAANTDPLSPSAISRRSVYRSRGSSWSLMNVLRGATTEESHPGYRGAGDRGETDLDDGDGVTGVRRLPSVVRVERNLSSVRIDGRRCPNVPTSGSRRSAVIDTMKASCSPNDDVRGDGSGEASEYTRLFGFDPDDRQSDASVVSVCGRESEEAEPVPVDNEAVVEEVDVLE